MGRRAGATSRHLALCLAAAGPLGALGLCAALVPQRCARPPSADTRAPSAYVVASPATGRAPLHVRLDGSGSTDDSAVTSWRWDFGDGTTGEGQIVDHVFATAGRFGVRLAVQDAAGNGHHTTSVVSVDGPRDARPPRAVVAADRTHGPAPLAVAFDAAGSTDDHGVVRVRWTFDDGEHAEGLRVAHVFAVPGRYEVSAEVSDLAGNLGSATREVVVEAGPPSLAPRASLRVTPARAVAPAEVELDGSGSSDDRAIVRWDWTFGDGQSARGPVVRHRYAHAGRFRATLVVWDDRGQADRAATDLELAAPPMTAERVLYDDRLGEGVQDGSWARVEPVSAPVHAGRFALTVMPQAFGALRLRFAPERLDAWDRVGFWLLSSRPETLSVRALWDDDGKEVLGEPVPLSRYLLGGAGGALQDAWRRGAVPLSDLGAEGRRVTGFAWQAGQEPVPFVLDDVGLVPPDVTLPVLSECALPPPIRGFVERRDAALEADGVPFRAVGANLYYLQSELSRHVQTGEVRPLANVREALAAAGCAGATVVRLLAFNENPPETQDISVIQTAPGTYREEGLEGLDLAVAEAKARHLRVILTLANNWSHYGGLPRYAGWAGVPPERALQVPAVREWLSDYVRMLARRVNVFTGTRYADEPALLALEIANELRCRDCVRGRDATAFTAAMAKVVKEAFPNHLVADGGEGFDDAPALYPALLGTSVVRGDEGQSFHRLALVPELDLVSYHLYPEAWGLGADEATAYIDAHEAIARAAGKVAYLGEFGERDDDRSRAVTYERWLDRLFGAADGSLGLVWQVTYPGRGDNDGFALEPGRSPSSMAAIARAGRLLAAPGLEGVGLATRWK